MADAIFSLEGVSFAYPGGRAVLAGVDLGIGEGEFVLVRGPSGAGKSTLLRLLNGLLVPAAGVVRFRGRPLATYDPTRLRRRVVYLQQTPVMAEGTVGDNLLLPFRFRSSDRAAPPAADELAGLLAAVRLDGVGLEDAADRLSVGQRQRLALIRALLLGPEALLLDEPTAALDPESRQVVEERLVALHRERGVTVVLVTHAGEAPAGVRPRVLWVEGGAVRERAAGRGCAEGVGT